MARAAQKVADAFAAGGVSKAAHTAASHEELADINLYPD